MPRIDSPEAKIARIMSHPLRPRILEILKARGEASPNEIAAELGVPLGTLSYHTRLLRDTGWIECVREVPRRGAVEHFYRVVDAGGLQEAGAHVHSVPLELDERGRTELSEAVTKLIADLSHIQDRSNARRGPDARSRSTLAILHYRW